MLIGKKILLEGTREERIRQILKMAGWYDGRCVDISKVEAYYRNENAPLIESARKFFSEFHGLASAWYVRHELTKEYAELPPFAPDFFFELYPNCLYDEGYSILSIDQPIIDDIAKEKTILVGDIGHYYPAKVWIGESETFYTLHEFDDGIVHVYGNFMDFLKWEFQKHTLDSAAVYFSGDEII